MASAEFKKWVAGITVDFHKTSQDAEKSARKALNFDQYRWFGREIKVDYHQSAERQ